MIGGLSAEAAPLHQQARSLMYVLVDRDPGDRQAKRMLGSVLYGLGATLPRVEQPNEALAALTECDGVYGELDALGEPGMQPLIADVRVRKANVLSELGRGVSAVMESDQAVMTYLDLGADNSAHPLYLDLARVLSLNSNVLYNYGDHDLAVCSADWAVRYYLAKAEAINNAPLAESFMHGLYLREAARIAVRVHTEQGRPEIALAVGEAEVHTARAIARSNAPEHLTYLASALTRHGLNLRKTGRTDKGTELVEEGRGIDSAAASAATEDWRSISTDSTGDTGDSDVSWPLSFSAALTAAARKLGDDRVPSILRELAFNPAERATTVTPSLRCQVQIAPAAAAMLAELAVGLLDDPDPYSAREAGLLGREAHYLFAAASRARVISMRYQFHEFGAVWARMLLALIPAFETNSAGAAIAEDLAGWLAGITLQLQPFTFVDQETGRLVEECNDLVERILS
ncbi:hypothetical protein [Streptomyces graminilatus]|uniref:hypothetical protein n=1 Tax=Streptomyces graminilatus TaxID=1464070 RepID=UPI0018E3B267|nr:hypothetical protein [Streptomyces graminilatus]